MEIILVRHTSVAVGRGICYGRTDVEVADSFESEAEIVLSKMPINIDDYQIISSPLKRCRQLARKINNYFTVEEALVELSFGDWEMRRWNEVPREAIDNWANNLSEFRCPGGESFEELIGRIVPKFENYFSEPGNKIIVAHGGVIRSIIGYILGIPINNIFKIRIDYGSVTRIEIINNLPVITVVNV